MLKIFKDSLDISLEMESYVTDSVTLSLLTTETIDIGYFKPINSIYFDIKPHLTGNNLALEFWDGSAWLEITERTDKTLGLKRSGFVSWKRNIDIQQASLLHGSTLYWYRIRVGANDITALELKGVNLVFADDYDLLESYPDIMEYLPDGADSFIAYHQSARNFILTYLRNKGKNVESYGVFKMMDQFDLHNYEEVRQAAKYKALAMIFFNESDSVDDKWYQKAKDFDALYGSSIDMSFLSIDKNNDGKSDATESQAIQFIVVQRL